MEDPSAKCAMSGTRARVQSMDIRACGEEVHIDDLETPITFTTSYSAQENQSRAPACLYFNTSKKIWTDEGCWVEQQLNNSIICACSHLSAFTDGFIKAIDAIVATVVCNAADVIFSKEAIL